MKLMVFDVGGTEIKYAVMDEELNLSDKGYVPTPQDTFEHFAETIRSIYLPHKDEVEGMALSMPGFVDPVKGIIPGGGKLRYIWDREVARELSEYCGCKVILENDGKAAAWAEYTVGSLKGTQNAAVFVMGTGVGGGLIINGELVRGKHGTAGEYSFMINDGEKVNEPFGFVGLNCSTTGLLFLYKQLKQTEEEIDGREFFKRLENDEIARKTLDIFAEKVAHQIFNLYWLLDIEKIAIGGGISRQPILTERINEKFQDLLKNNAYAILCRHVPLEIVTAKYSNDANMIGAYMTYRKYAG